APVALGDRGRDAAEGALGLFDDLSGVVDDAPAPLGAGGSRKCHYVHRGLLTRTASEWTRRAGRTPSPPRGHERSTRLPAVAAGAAAATGATAAATAEAPTCATTATFRRLRPLDLELATTEILAVQLLDGLI